MLGAEGEQTMGIFILNEYMLSFLHNKESWRCTVILVAQQLTVLNTIEVYT